MDPNSMEREKARLKAAHRRLWPHGNVPGRAAPAAPKADAAGDGAELEIEEPVCPGASQRSEPAPLEPPPSAELEEELAGVHARIGQLERSRQCANRGLVLVLSFLAALVAAGVVRAGHSGARSPIPLPAANAAVASGSSQEVVDLTVRGVIRIVDDDGHEIGLFGRQPLRNGEREAVALVLNSPTLGGPRETLRLSALDSGATVSLQTPDLRSSMTLLSGTNGPFIVLKEDATSRVISELQEPRPTLARADSPTLLPAVGAGEASGLVDLGRRDVQRIGHGFMVIGLERRASDRAALIRGRLINTSSVRHANLQFRLVAGGRSAVFRVSVISPGNSTAFSVELPDVDAATLGDARIEYVSSTVRFQRHRIWGEAGLHRPDWAALTD